MQEHNVRAVLLTWKACASTSPHKILSAISGQEECSPQKFLWVLRFLINGAKWVMTEEQEDRAW